MRTKGFVLSDREVIRVILRVESRGELTVTLRFDRFTLDPETGELRKDGDLVKLKPQPAQVLVLLASRAGTVVTRDEIQKALWPDETYVDFDLGINSCIRQIRIALGDDAEAPRYVQTVSRRGYRFVATLEPDNVGDGGLGGGVGEVSGRLLASPRPIWQRALPWSIVAAVVLAAIFLGTRNAPLEMRVFRSEISVPSGTRLHLESSNPGPPVLSPDGRMLAFSARDAEGNVTLYVRALDATVARALSGTERAQYPFWSPDSRWIGFFAERKLKKIEATGGVPVSLCPAINGKGGTWNRDDVIVFSQASIGPLHRVSADGGESTPITELDDVRGDNAHRHPRFLPDGRHFLYLARNISGAERNVTVLGSLDGGPPAELIQSPVAATYASGHLLFLSGRSLMAQRYDVERSSLVGEATPVAEDVAAVTSAAIGVYSASQSGELIYLKGEISLGTAGQLEWVDRAGNSQGFLENKAQDEEVFPSPDGLRVAVPFFDSAGTYDLWIYDIVRQTRTRFTFDPGLEMDPVWSPDASTLIFRSNRTEGRFELYRKAVEGSAEQELIHASDVAIVPTSWSPDGKLLAFHYEEGDVWMLPLETEGDAKPYAFIETDARELWGVFSPDGRWLAYESDESGQAEVYVTPFPGPGRKWQVSKDGGKRPWWRHDGREIIYQEAGRLVVAVEVGGGEDTFMVGAHAPLFETRPSSAESGHPYYAPMPDAQKFLVVRVEEEDLNPLTLVVNWTADLEQ